MWNVGYTSSVQGSCGVKARIVIPYASVLYRIGLIGAGTGYPLRPSTPAMRHEASLERVKSFIGMSQALHRLGHIRNPDAMFLNPADSLNVVGYTTRHDGPPQRTPVQYSTPGTKTRDVKAVCGISLVQRCCHAG